MSALATSAADAPVFWTREQRGEEASPWLMSGHKLDYLQATTALYSGGNGRLTPRVLHPESAVTGSARPSGSSYCSPRR